MSADPRFTEAATRSMFLMEESWASSRGMVVCSNVWSRSRTCGTACMSKNEAAQVTLRSIAAGVVLTVTFPQGQTSNASTIGSHQVCQMVSTRTRASRLCFSKAVTRSICSSFIRLSELRKLGCATDPNMLKLFVVVSSLSCLCAQSFDCRSFPHVEQMPSGSQQQLVVTKKCGHNAQYLVE